MKKFIITIIIAIFASIGIYTLITSIDTDKIINNLNNTQKYYEINKNE